MKSLKRLSILLSFFVIFVAFGIIKSNASSDLHLKNLDFNAQINSDGSIDITETWDISIEDTNTLYKTFKTDNSKYSSISNVNVIEITNGQEKAFNRANEWKYHLDKDYYYGGLNRDKEFEICWGVNVGSNTARRKFKISYRVNDAIRKADDYAQLYWQFVGKEFEISADKVTGEILLPRKAELKDDVKVWGHTEDLNGEIYVTDLNTVKFEINHFRSGRYIEVRILFPTEMIMYSGHNTKGDILDSVIEEETVWANEANRRREINERNKLIFAGILIVVTIVFDIIFICVLVKTIKKIKNTKKLVPTQSIEYFREIPREKEVTPAEASYLFRGIKNSTGVSPDLGKIFSASMLDLNLKKFIDFEVLNPSEKKETVKITLLKENSSQLDEVQDEKIIYEFLQEAVKDKKEITIKELEKYIKNHTSKVEKLAKKIQSSVKDRLYKKEFLTKENDKKIEKATTSILLTVFYIIFTVPFMTVPLIMFENIILLFASFATTLIAIIVAIAQGIYSSKIVFGTQKAIDEQAQWKGLKKYMEDFSLLKERELPEIVLWEKFLVYATVFGIEKKVLEQLKMTYPDFEHNTTINNSAYMHMMMNTNFSSSFSSAVSSSMTSAYSSATGGGGGFSGGGGRWPEAADGGRWKIIFFHTLKYYTESKKGKIQWMKKKFKNYMRY